MAPSDDRTTWIRHSYLLALGTSAFHLLQFVSGTALWRTTGSPVLLAFALDALVSSMGSVLLEELVYQRYNDWGDLMRLVGLCFLEPLGYRLLNTLWRMKGLWHFFNGRNSWQLIDRVGFNSQTDPAT